MAQNPWKKLLANIMLSATYGAHGGRSETNPKFSGRKWAKNAANSSQSTRRHDISIGWEDLRNQFHKQNGRCFWFGIELAPNDIFKSYYPLAMSVDRIDNKEGYHIDNIVITCRLANLGRGNCSVEDYKKIISKLNLPNESLIHNHFFDFNNG